MDGEKLSDLEMDYVMICLLQSEMTQAFSRIGEFFKSARAMAGVELGANVFADMATMAEESRQAFMDRIGGFFAEPNRVLEFLESHDLAVIWKTSNEGE